MKSFVVLSLTTRKTMVRPSGESTAAGPTSIASDPGTPMVLVTRVTGAGAVAGGGAEVVDVAGIGRVSTTARAIAVAAKRIHGSTRSASPHAAGRTPPVAVVSPVGRPVSPAALPAMARSSVMRASPMSRSRCLGSRSRQRTRSVRTAAGVAAGSAAKSIGWRRTAAIVSEMPSPLNNRLPVSISKHTTPNAQTSARRSTVLPRACSGAM